MKLKLIVLFLLLLGKVYAQDPVFRNYTTFDGLPSSETYCIMQDHKGYIWIGTDRGLVIFDGQHFRTLSSADGLRDNVIFELIEDKQQRIWHRSYSSKVGYIDKNKQIVYPHLSLLKTVMRNGIIHNLIIGNEDTVYASYDRRDTLEAVIVEGGNVHTLQYQPGVRDVYLSEDNRCISFGTEMPSEIRILSLETKKLLYQLKVTPRKPYLVEEAINTIAARTKNGDIIICLLGQVYQLSPKGIRMITHTPQPIFALTVDNEDGLWIGSLHKGLQYYDAASGYSRVKNYLPRNSISCIMQDKEGGMWFTSTENGIYYLPPDYMLSYTTANGLTSPKVLRVAPTKNNMALILSDYSLLLKQPGNPVLKKRNFPVRIYDIAADGDISYYSTSDDKKAHEYDPSNIYIFDLKKIIVGKDYIWGCAHTIAAKHNKQGNLLHLIDLKKTARSSCVFENKKGELLIGTLEGLYIYTKKETVRKVAKYHLLQGRINDIVRINDTCLGIATMGNGLLIINEDNYKIIDQLTTKNGLAENICYDLLQDTYNTLWIGTNRGLSRVYNPLHPEKRKIHNIDIANGLVSNEVNHMCQWNNELWVATNKGVSILNLDKIRQSSYTIPIYIEQVTVNGRNVVPGQKLAYDQHNIRIDYTAPNYQYAGKLSYIYRLTGAGNTWDTTTNRTVEYKNLGAGDYRFEIQPLLPDTKMGSMAIYSFTIEPAFWQTWWFILLSILATGGVIALIIHYRVRFIKKQVSMQNDLHQYRDKALRAQMNPHFIYNAMNAIQNYIRKNDIHRSSDILNSFSRLMRLTFNNSGYETVLLSRDLEALQLYISMEQMRFPDRFKFHLAMDERIDADKISVPPFILQPFIENAINHGFSLKETTGNILLDIDIQKNRLQLKIKDDGIGREKAMEVKQRKEKYQGEPTRASGISVTLSRIQLAWGRNPAFADFTITDLYDENQNPSGTIVKFYLPLIYDKNNNS